MEYYSSFVIKIWVTNSGKMSKGYIQHVNTQQSMHFLTLDQMVAFVNNRLSLPPNHRVDVEEGAALRRREKWTS